MQKNISFEKVRGLTILLKLFCANETFISVNETLAARMYSKKVKEEKIVIIIMLANIIEIDGLQTRLLSRNSKVAHFFQQYQLHLSILMTSIIYWPKSLLTTKSIFYEHLLE